MIAFVRPPPGTPTETILALAEAGFVPDGPDAPWVVVHDPDEIGRTEGHLWLRGLEAGGPTGHSAAVVSIRAAVASGQPWVAEGLSARGMAAALAVGAAGIVIDAPLWLARESPLSDAERAAVRSASSGHDTTLSGELEGTLVRSLVRGAVSLPAPQNVADARAFDGVPMVEIARAVLRNVEERRARIADHHPLRAGLDPLRTGVPIVQGPMANVAEGTGLARSVRAAGAMPFAALGALDPAQAGDVLRAWADDVPAPWGVGIIGFDVMPYRDAHLAQVAALGARGPAAVILAGASPALALQVAARGAEPWLHTPSGRLV